MLADTRPASATQGGGTRERGRGPYAANRPTNSQPPTPTRGTPGREPTRPQPPPSPHLQLQPPQPPQPLDNHNHAATPSPVALTPSPVDEWMQEMQSNSSPSETNRKSAVSQLDDFFAPAPTNQSAGDHSNDGWGSPDKPGRRSPPTITDQAKRYIANRIRPDEGDDDSATAVPPPPPPTFSSGW
eukprot:TRINITY_DN49165_c0_g1_i1.p3 TRINITY_DN49165_c0_g1~~TRINITY_DN49165_c0_g1_i1.p3  ORF type:complete len:211 (-),score=45.33 TRINITY_DN49165_c0_g1_i1:1004-1558(-)